MNDLEERLREDLRAATDWIPDDVDPHTVLWTGRRVRRSRLISRTAVAAALVVVVGLVAPAVWNILLPAPRVPSPMQTVSAVPSDPPANPLSTTFDFSDSGVADLESIRVDAQPAGDEVGLTVTVKAEGVAAAERRFTVPANEAWHVAWDKHLVIGILPDRVQWFSGVYKSDRNGHYSDQRSLEGIGSTAVWMYFEKAGTAEHLTGFIWQGVDGNVNSTDGGVLPSATVTLSSSSFLVYRTSATDVWLRSSSGGGWGTVLGEPGDIVDGGMGTQADDGTWEWSQFGLLPAGAHDVELTLVKSEGAGEWGSAVMTDGTVAVVAQVRGVEETGDVVRSLRYTNSAGERVVLGK